MLCYLPEINILEVLMLSWSIAFLIVAIIAGFFGFTGAAGLAVTIAKVLFVLFLVLFVVSFFMGRGKRTPRI